MRVRVRVHVCACVCVHTCTCACVFLTIISYAGGMHCMYSHRMRSSSNSC